MPRIVIKLREVMQKYKRDTGERMTYKILGERTGIAAATLGNMGSNPRYNATLVTLTKICTELRTTPGELLEYIPDPPKAAAKPSRKKAGG